MGVRLERSENAFGPSDDVEMFESYVEGEEVSTVTVSREWWEEEGMPTTIEVEIRAVGD